MAWRFAMSPTLNGFMRETPEGDIIMAALTDTGEGVVVVTTPANPFLPKGMQPGEARSYTQQVSVNYLDDPNDQRYSGSLTGTYTYVGTYQVTVPPARSRRSYSASSARSKLARLIRRTRATTFSHPASGWSR